MHLTFMNHDLSGLISSLPMPLLLLLLLVLILVFVGLLSRIRSMVKGQVSPIEYAGMALVIAFFILLAVMLAGAAFNKLSLP